MYNEKSQASGSIQDLSYPRDDTLERSDISTCKVSITTLAAKISLHVNDK
jgi:hypothetical protein